MKRNNKDYILAQMMMGVSFETSRYQVSVTTVVRENDDDRHIPSMEF